MPQSRLTAWLQKATPAAIPAQHEEHNRGEDGSKTYPAAQLITASVASQTNVHRRDIDNSTKQQTSTNASTTRKLASPGPKLPPNAEIRNCTKADIPAFKQINSLLLPVAYPDSFYRAIHEDAVTSNLTLVATWQDDVPAKDQPNQSAQVIGGIRCRLLGQPIGSNASPSGVDTATKERQKPMLYLSTLVLLSPYRSHGIAAMMLRTITARAIETYGIGSVGAHVWESNAEGLEWYRKRGFREVGREECYYRKLKPSAAVVMKRDVSVMDLLPPREESDQSR